MPWPSLNIQAGAAPTLRIEFSEGDNNIMFLYPALGPEDEEPIGDTTVAGNVILTLPVPTKVKLVTVELLGQQLYRFRGKARRLEHLRKVITVNMSAKSAEQQEEELPAGEHTFAFSINVPANVAPSLQSDFGRIKYDLNARISHLGRLGRNLECTRRIGLFVNHSAKYSGFPPAHSSQRQLFHDRFGPMSIEATSKHFMIGGYLRWKITWAEYLLPFKISDLTVEIVQTFTVKPSLDVVEPLEQYQQRHTLYRLDEDLTWPDNLKRVIRPGDEAVSISRQMRIPYSQAPPLDKLAHLVPSHHPASQSCVMPSTQIVFTLIFEQYEGAATPTQDQLNKPSLQKLQLSWQAVLSSCFLRREYMVLPAYDAAKEGVDNFQITDNITIPKGIYGFPQCMCKELSGEEEQEYGVSQEEIEAQARGEEAARAWMENTRAAKADLTP